MIHYPHIEHPFSVHERYRRAGRDCCVCGQIMPDRLVLGVHSKGLVSLLGKKGWDGRVTKEHVIPTSLGGVYGLRNVLFAHGRCNTERGNAMPTQAMLKALFDLNVKCLVKQPDSFAPPFYDLSFLMKKG